MCVFVFIGYLSTIVTYLLYPKDINKRKKETFYGRTKYLYIPTFIRSKHHFFTIWKRSAKLKIYLLDISDIKRLIKNNQLKFITMKTNIIITKLTMSLQGNVITNTM